MSPSHEGGCHCGALGFTYTSAIPPEAWPVRACQCSFCRCHGARCTSDPEGSVRLRISRPEWLARYSFGLRTADFLICGACGVYVAAVLSTGRGSFATVNLNCLTTPVAGLPAAAPVSYDSESREERVRRRETRWTPVRGPA